MAREIDESESNVSGSVVILFVSLEQHYALFDNVNNNTKTYSIRINTIQPEYATQTANTTTGVRRRRPSASVRDSCRFSGGDKLTYTLPVL